MVRTLRILFDPKVARYVQRRAWHPTQRFRRVYEKVEMTMDVRGTVKVVSWVLGLGSTAQVIEPNHCTMRYGLVQPLTPQKKIAVRSSC